MYSLSISRELRCGVSNYCNCPSNSFSQFPRQWIPFVASFGVVLCFCLPMSRSQRHGWLWCRAIAAAVAGLSSSHPRLYVAVPFSLEQGELCGAAERNGKESDHQLTLRDFLYLSCIRQVANETRTNRSWRTFSPIDRTVPRGDPFRSRFHFAQLFRRLQPGAKDCTVYCAVDRALINTHRDGADGFAMIVSRLGLESVLKTLPGGDRIGHGREALDSPRVGQ